jgi:hypothetical protein
MPSISTQSPARSPRYVDWAASAIAIMMQSWLPSGIGLAATA